MLKMLLLFVLLTVYSYAEYNSSVVVKQDVDLNTTIASKKIRQKNIDKTLVDLNRSDTNMSNPSNIMDPIYTSKNNMTREHNTSHKDILDEQNQEADKALKELKNYNSAMAEGNVTTVIAPTTHSEDLSVDDNNSMISTKTKLDDVSNLDIAKEQRKQRKEARKKEHEKPTDKVQQRIDTIVVKGSVLQGQIDQLTSEFISFKLVYGEGSIRIDYADVDTLSTEHEYHIYFDGKETLGYITAIKEHAFLELKHGEVEELITISKIDRLIISEKEDTSFENRMRNKFPYFSGNMDLGLEYESGSNKKRKLKVAGRLTRMRASFKTVLDVNYAYEETKTVDTVSVLNKHELYSFLEQDYSLSEHDLLIAEIGYDFDVPRYVDNRLYPSLGYGYKIMSEKKQWIQFKVGLGYVYETFLGNEETNRSSSRNHYVSGLLGMDAEYEIDDLAIINRVLLGAHFFYMPGIQNPRENWLLRYALTASVPISKMLSLVMVGRQITDDNPSPEIGNNKLTFDMYFRLRF